MMIISLVSILFLLSPDCSSGFALHGGVKIKQNYASRRMNPISSIQTSSFIADTDSLTSDYHHHDHDAINGNIANHHSASRIKLPSTFARKVLHITMGKGDGKKKRPKKKDTDVASSSIAPPPSSPQPQRVSNNINIPVRHQIRYAQMRKEAARMSGTSFRANNVKRTSYRKNLGKLYYNHWCEYNHKIW